MAEETKKLGHLRYKSGCGAFLKIDCDDPKGEFRRLIANNQRLIPHECDPLRQCVAKLIGSTLSEDSTKYCHTSAE